jgi:hypothetical protein
MNTLRWTDPDRVRMARLGRALVASVLALPALACGNGSSGNHAPPDASTDRGSDALARDAGSKDAPPHDAVVSDAPLDSVPPEAAVTFYGEGIGADALDNQQVANVDVDIRFRAATTANLTSFIWYDIYDPKCAPHSDVDAGTCPTDCSMSGSVYACGTGGDMHVCVQSDDGTANHMTTGVDLACLDHPNASGPPYFPVETFSTPAHLTQGVLYHLHWHNTDPSPTENFTSVDALYVNNATVPRQPTIPDLDLALFRGSMPRPLDTPIVQLTYEDGTVQGQGYMEVWVGTPEPISGAAMVRETFMVSGGDRTVSLVGVRLNRAMGTSALDVQLETGGGTLIEEGMIPSSSFPLEPIGPGTSPTWATLAFTSSHILMTGQGYQLVLSAPSDTLYEAYSIERGAHYGFLPPTLFGDGYGEYTADGGSWSGFNQPGGSSDSMIADLQFYFEN